MKAKEKIEWICNELQKHYNYPVFYEKTRNEYTNKKTYLIVLKHRKKECHVALTKGYIKKVDVRIVAVMLMFDFNHQIGCE